jgi:hypothetical protein
VVLATQGEHDLRLQRIGVLIFVDQHMRELARGFQPSGRLGQRAPEQQQIVVVEQVLSALATGVDGKDVANAVHLLGTPRVGELEHRAQTKAGVDHPRIDRHERVLAREATLALLDHAELQLAANQIQQVGHVGLVEHSEVGREAQRSTVQPKQTIGHGVEGAAPDLRDAPTRDEPIGACEHLARGAARERQ